MEPTVKEYVKSKYKEGKSDLFSAFMLRCLDLVRDGGHTGFMTPFVWMFISSYESMREMLIDQHFITSLVQLEYSGFEGATVPVCTFTSQRQASQGRKGGYVRLDEFRGARNQAPKTLEAIVNPDCGWFYRSDQINFG